ncbi:MAG: cell envelope integrity protein TolA [Gammaproteobacteria bacterium]|jgi:colicin import membrane protein
MASQRRDRQLAFVLSMLGHAAIVAALTFSIPLGRNRPAPGPVVVPIEAVMINEAAIEAEMARIEAAEEAERQRQLELERQRQREEQERQERLRQEQAELERIRQEQEAAEQERLRLQAEAADAERRRLAILEEERLEAERIAEQQRIERERQEAERLAAEQAAEAERQRQEEERRRQEEERLAAERAAEEERLRREAEERARREAVEAEIARAIAAEQEARAARDAGLRDQWARAISDRVALYWIRPPNVSSELECVLIVEQLPNGEVVNVTTDRCNTSDSNIIRSIENAVLNASPLPQPPRGVAFERVVRITFSPID